MDTRYFYKDQAPWDIEWDGIQLSFDLKSQKEKELQDFISVILNKLNKKGKFFSN